MNVGASKQSFRSKQTCFFIGSMVSFKIYILCYLCSLHMVSDKSDKTSGKNKIEGAII